MTKPKADWYQTCEKCGTQLAAEFSDNCPETCNCPWCGALMRIDPDSVRTEKDQAEIQNSAPPTVPR